MYFNGSNKCTEYSKADGKVKKMTEEAKAMYDICGRPTPPTA